MVEHLCTACSMWCFLCLVLCMYHFDMYSGSFVIVVILCASASLNLDFMHLYLTGVTGTATIGHGTVIGTGTEM